MRWMVGVMAAGMVSGVGAAQTSAPATSPTQVQSAAPPPLATPFPGPEWTRSATG